MIELQFEALAWLDAEKCTIPTYIPKQQETADVAKISNCLEQYRTNWYCLEPVEMALATLEPSLQ